MSTHLCIVRPTIIIVVSNFSYAFSFIGIITIRRVFVFYERLQRLMSRISRSCKISYQSEIIIFTALQQLIKGKSKIYLIYQFSLKHKNSILCQCLLCEIIYLNKTLGGVPKKYESYLEVKILKKTCNGAYF